MKSTIHTAIAAAGVAALLMLGACAESGLTPTEQAALTPADRVFELRSEFEMLTRVGANYAKQPACSATLVTACHDKAVTAALSKYGHAADDQIKSAEVLVRSGTATPAQTDSAITGARTALASLSAYVVAKGIN